MDSSSSLIAQLSELAMSDFGNRFGVWGVVKETSVDDEGLVNFVQDYFSFDLYRDEGLSLYSALGNRSIFSLTTWNPWRWYQWLTNVSNRLQSKNITGNFKGEGIVQGGILIFDRTGTLRFAYEEETGEELKSADILAALRVLENEQEIGEAKVEVKESGETKVEVKEDL
jgi:AhpC/TSA antioxidant enzyme